MPKPAPSIPYPPDAFHSEFHTVNGARLHIKIAGEGPPLLLLHGYPETWYTWRFVMEALAGQFTLYAPDFRGWGESEATGPYTMRSMAEDTLALMNLFGHTTYNVVGHDWGAAVAYALSKNEGARIAKLMTVNMPVKRADLTRPLHFYFYNMPLLPDLLMHVGSDSVVRGILRWWGYNQEAFPANVIEIYQAAARQPGANAASLGYYRNMVRSVLFRTPDAYGLGSKPHKPAMPWQVLWGANDRVSPLKNVAYFKEDMPGVPVTLIDNAGHFPQEEQPVEFVRLVREFMGR